MVHLNVDIRLDEPVNMDDVDELITRGRNSRRPKKANHGARPCSSHMRKLKKKGWFNKVKED